MKNLQEDALFEHYKFIAKIVAETFTPYAEVIIHDLRQPKSSIIAIYNNHVTGREVGDAASSLGHDRLKGKVEDYLVNYPNISPKQTPMRSSSLAIRNVKNEIIGSFCINIDITHFSGLKCLFDTLVSPIGTRTSNIQENYPTQDLHTEISEKIDYIVTLKGWQRNSLNSKQKKDIVLNLKKEGVFQKRHAIKTICNHLSVTRPTVYNYLK